MKFSKAPLAAVVLAFCITPRSTGRLISEPSYQELLDKSDLVIIATPITKTTDTKEVSFLPNIFDSKKFVFALSHSRAGRTLRTDRRAD